MLINVRLLYLNTNLHVTAFASVLDSGVAKIFVRECTEPNVRSSVVLRNAL